MDPTNGSPGNQLRVGSSISCLASPGIHIQQGLLTVGRAVTGARLCPQHREPVRPGGRRAPSLHVAKPSPKLPCAELCHQPASRENVPPSPEAWTCQLGRPLWHTALRGYFQILGDIPLPLRLIGPRRSPPPSASVPLAVLNPACLPWASPPSHHSS